MLDQRVQHQFFESADLQYQVAELLARPIADAAAALLGAITGGGKLLVAGTGAAAGLAQHLADLFVTRFERDRPPLAALTVGTGPAAPSQVQALGLPGDVLLLVDGGFETGDCEPLILAAQAKDMTLVLLSGPGASAWKELLAETDVLIALPAERRSRVAELQLLVLHCLCDAVDFQLMGEQEP